jgi:hypothetical protein
MSKSNKTGNVAGVKTASIRTSTRPSRRSDNGRTNTGESTPDPLSLWRTLCARQFTAADVLSMQYAVANVVPFGVRKWPAARDDVAAAVGAAFDLLPLDELTVPFDLCMTMLGLHAIEGDSAAAIVLSNVLQNLPGHARSHRRIATSWFVANLASAAALSRDSAKLPSGHPAPARKMEKPS